MIESKVDDNKTTEFQDNKINEFQKLLIHSALLVIGLGAKLGNHF